ncbi:isoform CRA_b [Magnaporthiopsis poae ATCC 64411]|uniref:Isoform CRA_b n=1 Tax=Magnaporthiopsis poae (strain ATCC 64411 / 73-15) TaxID=644358 RepID=A0A0C4E8K4_MAGP6|nr:isoform CRA_b [Magnaporthiopsis poae ATCC 64411]
MASELHYTAVAESLREPRTPDDDTIYALSSAQGRAGVAVIRLSGPDCLEVYRRLCPGKAVPEPRYAVVRALYEPIPERASDVLDSGTLILYFPGPKSVTGEDVLELHTHGGPATDFLAEAAVGGPDGGAAPDTNMRECGGLDEPDVVLAAEHLRYAAATLAAITGRGDSGDVEEVLGVIFEKFCVGK